MKLQLTIDHCVAGDVQRRPIGEGAKAGGLQAGGHPLPILRSQNLPGAIESNRELAKKYKGRLSRQLA